MRVKSENISLTDKYEFFRFLPIKRNNIVKLFCCPLCLEKLDTSSTGIHTLISMGSTDRWENYKKLCNICKKFSQKTTACLKCNSKENIWCCMICGFTGCDRYQQGHAVEHFNNTLHRYSIDLASQRIWDYLGDGWVHRVIKLKPSDNNLIPSRDTIFLENEISSDSSTSTKEFLMRMENIISEYNFVLASQLEDQRKYYEKELNRLDESNEQRLKTKAASLNTLREELTKKKNLLENSKKFMKECSKKLNHQEKRLEDVKQNIQLNNSLVENLKKDIGLLKTHREINFNKEIGSKEKKILESKLRRKEELQKQLDNMYKVLSEK
jgi:BRCA1-associated protein